GRAEAVRRTGHPRAGRIAESPDVERPRHCRIEDSRPVQMDGKAGLVGDLAQGGGLRRAEARSAFAIVSVLEAEKSGYRLVDIGWADRAAHLLRRKPPVPGVEWPELKAADDRGTRHLVLKDVTVDFEDHLLSRLGVAEQGTEVAHGPARNKQR